MLRSISLATVLALATLTGLACIDDSATEEDLAQDLDDVDGKDDGLGPLKPYGSFVAEPAGAGEFLKLALNDDRSYSREILVYCITTPCNPIVETGTFKFTRSNYGRRYIRFLDEAGHLRDRFEYRYAGTDLDLRRVGTSDWFTMTREQTQPSCADVGGTCRGSTLDVTFPANCEEEFGETTSDATCEAINRACCVPSDCRATGCDAGRYCTFCWTGFACIPDGALC